MISCDLYRVCDCQDNLILIDNHKSICEYIDTDNIKTVLVDICFYLS